MFFMLCTDTVIRRLCILHAASLFECGYLFIVLLFSVFFCSQVTSLCMVNSGQVSGCDVYV